MFEIFTLQVVVFFFKGEVGRFFEVGIAVFFVVTRAELTFFLIAIRDFGFPVARLLINVKRQTGRASDLF